MKIGIYGSSFDPITNVHLWTANTVLHRKKLDKVIFLPSSTKRRDKTTNVNDTHRVNMIQLAIEDNPNFELDPYELNVLAGNHYTYHTMKYFREKYPNDEVDFIMGADCLQDISDGKWSFSEGLISENQFIIMARNGIDMLKAISSSPILRNYDDGRFHLLDKGLAMEISSTYIREELSVGGDPRYLLPECCYKYIKENKLYHRPITT
jgi:nicotinate-nucleotide adenylyltransferase